MSGFDAYSPREIAHRVQEVSLLKARLPFLPLAMMLQASAGQAVEYAGLWRNLVPVIAGNLVGGSVLVALVYYVIYGRGASASAASSARTSSGPESE